MESFSYYDLGRIEYGKALDLQTNSFESLIDAKRKGLEEQNCLYFCEHNPVLTLGKSGKETNLLVPELLLKEKGVSLFHIDRGGGYYLSWSWTNNRLSGFRPGWIWNGTKSLYTYAGRYSD